MDRDPPDVLPDTVASRARWLDPRVAFLSTERPFPSSHGLALTDGDDLVLVDAGLDEAALSALAPHLSTVLVTHCHLDHVIGIEALEEVPVVWNEAETDVLDDDLDRVLDFLGVEGPARQAARGLFDWTYPDVPEPVGAFEPGEALELAGLRVETVPVPGHSPGHVALGFPDAGLLFTVDVEFRGLGPWYGWPHCSATRFEEAARKLRSRCLEADVVATSHSAPIAGEPDRVGECLDRFVARFGERDEAVADGLWARGSEGATTGELVEEVRIFYGDHLDVRDHLRFFCRVMTEDHLARLRDAGRVRRDGDRWVAVG